jgi:hypothetical protein
MAQTLRTPIRVKEQLASLVAALGPSLKGE